MSVIIRLQNLPWSANALDIRQFFSGLGIPEGGVHIVGGELGDAFIAFSTDEDARQAFNLNGGKLKEVQVKLMLSSRTEMQKVIEAARNPLAAFMHTASAATTQPLAALLPAAVPAIVPEIKREESFSSSKRDKRRSRSRSRDRKDRSRDYDRDRRDRRRRDRSRSRSRDRRRRDRSHSRDRRSKERERRSKDRRHSEDKTGSSSNSSLNNVQRDNKIGVWEDPIHNVPTPALQQAQAILSTLLPGKIEEARRNITNLATGSLALSSRNGFQKQTDPFFSNRSNESWNSQNSFSSQDNGRPEHTSRFDRSNFKSSSSDRSNTRNILPNQTTGDSSRMAMSRIGRPDGRPNRFDMNSDKPNLSHRPPLLDRPPVMKRSPNEYMKHCCVQLQPFYGGYGEIRRFFQGFFIHNTGIKFINDDNGIRTGIVYIRFANPDGKEKALQKNGLKLKMKHVDIVDLDDETFDKTIDRFQPEHKEQNQYSPSSSYKSRDSTNSFNKKPLKFSCLAVDDLPLFTKEQDMLKIFSDYPLLSILLVTALRHITAYIKFNSSDDAKKALIEKSKQIFEGKLLGLRPCSDEEFALISKEEPDNNDVIEVEDEEKPFTSDCISLSGLPVKTTDRDITDFFSDVAIVPSKIHLINSPLGFTGQAYCEFPSAEDAEIAIDKNGMPLGSGVIAVSSISRNDMESIIGSTSRTNINVNPNTMPGQLRPPFFPRNFPRGPGPLLGPGPRGIMGPRPPMRRFLPPPPLLNAPDMAPPGCTVLMENVPYKAGLDEILEFFDGFEIPADNVLRRYNENGTPSGEAKVIFNSADDAYQAVQDCNHGKIRDRKIFLSQS